MACASGPQPAPSLPQSVLHSQLVGSARQRTSGAAFPQVASVAVE